LGTRCASSAAPINPARVTHEPQSLSFQFLDRPRKSVAVAANLQRHLAASTQGNIDPLRLTLLHRDVNRFLFRWVKDAWP
jgi:hypothetical protein